jgi:hypothetical protein
MENARSTEHLLAYLQHMQLKLMIDLDWNPISLKLLDRADRQEVFMSMRLL